jgi:hypothetical protein
MHTQFKEIISGGAQKRSFMKWANGKLLNLFSSSRNVSPRGEKNLGMIMQVGKSVLGSKKESGAYHLYMPLCLHTCS